MLAIHGIWADGALLLWAEDATRPQSAAAARPGIAEVPPNPGAALAAARARSGEARPDPAPAARADPALGRSHLGAGAREGVSKARPHPGAASPAALAAALAGLPGEAAELAWSGTEGEVILWLPGTAAGPQPSPELAAAPGEGTWLAPARGGGRAALRPWRVPVLSFPAPAALPLLAGLGQEATAGHSAGSDDALLPIGPDGELAGSGPGAEPAGEVLFGQSVPFLAACSALAADLAARGRLLPALTRLATPNDAAPLAPSESAAISAPATGSGPPASAEAVAGRLPSVSDATPERVVGPGSAAPSGPATGP